MSDTRWTPTRTTPSGTYGLLLREPEGGKPFIHVVQDSGSGWFPTPASWRIEDLAGRSTRLVTPLAIDAGQGWALSAEDTLALVRYAREIEAERDPEAARTECPRGCGHERITGSGSNSGFAGEGVWWTELACGHDVTETGDPLPYIR